MLRSGHSFCTRRNIQSNRHVLFNIFHSKRIVFYVYSQRNNPWMYLCIYLYLKSSWKLKENETSDVVYITIIMDSHFIDWIDIEMIMHMVEESYP